MTARGRHEALRPLLGAWAAGTCSRPQAADLALHLVECPDCAEEAARLSGAAAELAVDDPLDPSGTLRRQVLEHCLARRPAVLPMPPWAGPYAAESARLDALLRDLGPEEWHEVAELPWHGGVEHWRPAEVLCHLAAVDGYLSPALGLADPLAPAGPPAHDAPRRPPRVPEQGRPAGVMARTRALITAVGGDDPDQVRARWRGQSHALLRAAARSGGEGDAPVDYGFAVLPLRDAFLDRAFECWIHGDDIARAVDYPYPPPAPQHLRRLIDLGARMLPHVLAALRGPDGDDAADGRAGAGVRTGGRSLRLVIDGPAAGEWLIPLDGPDPAPGTDAPVAEMVMDGLEFCHLAAAHRDPRRLPLGEAGDRSAVAEVLRALPLLSRP